MDAIRLHWPVLLLWMGCYGLLEPIGILICLVVFGLVPTLTQALVGIVLGVLIGGVRGWFWIRKRMRLVQDTP